MTYQGTHTQKDDNWSVYSIHLGESINLWSHIDSCAWLIAENRSWPHRACKQELALLSGVFSFLQNLACIGTPLKPLSYLSHLRHYHIIPISKYCRFCQSETVNGLSDNRNQREQRSAHVSSSWIFVWCSEFTNFSASYLLIYVLIHCVRVIIMLPYGVLHAPRKT